MFDTNVKFDFVPDECGTEPTLRTIIEHYYSQCYEADKAKEFAALYIDLLKAGAPVVDGRDVRSAIDGLEGSVAVGSDGEWVSVRRVARDAAVMALRNVSLDCAHIYAAYSEAKASTPAAQGIDLEQFRRAVR